MSFSSKRPDKMTKWVDGQTETYNLDVDPGELLHGGLLLLLLRILGLQPFVLFHLSAQERGQDGKGSRGHPAIQQNQIRVGNLICKVNIGERQP